MRSREGTGMLLSAAQARIGLGSRVARLVGLVAVAGRRLRRLGAWLPTGRATSRNLSIALDRPARFLSDNSCSRHSPFQPSRTVATASDPSRSVTGISTDALLIYASHSGMWVNLPTFRNTLGWHSA